MGAYSYTDALERKKWVKDNLLNNAHKSFFSPITGATSDAIVYQERDLSASTGHTITFDYTGKLTGKMFRGSKYDDADAEIKRKFSDTIVVDEFSLYVDNGSKFKAAAIDDLEDNRHTDSISKLSDLFIRHKDQALFDTAQGIYDLPTHIKKLDTITLDTIIDISKFAKTGSGFVKPDKYGKPGTTKAVKRQPLEAYKTYNGRDMYLWVIDTYTATRLKKDPKFQNILSQADVRGRDNMVISGILGRIQDVIISESPVFFGASPDDFELGDTEIQQPGLRRYAVDTDGKVYWEGTAKFDIIEDDVNNGATDKSIYSRTILLGAGALQIAIGMDPDYVLEWGPFKKTSKSMLEFWANFKKTRLTLEKGKDFNGRVANVDYGVICIDIKN